MKIFIPGPTEVLPEVFAEMTRPMMGHRSPEASALQRRIAGNLQKVLMTQNEIVLSTSSGTGLMESLLRSCTGKRAAIFSAGAFGEKWFDIARGNGIPADIFECPYGEINSPESIDAALSTGKYDVLCVTHSETSTGVCNPLEAFSQVMKKYPDVVWGVDAVSSAAGMKIETDAWGIDFLMTSSQKALALPPGMAIAAVSPKAYERTGTVANRGYYFDLRRLYEFARDKAQAISTPCLSLMYAMDLQLQNILREGIQNRFERHWKMAEFIRAWAQEYFEIFGKQRTQLSNTVSVIKNTREIELAALNEKLAKRGMQIGDGYGRLKGKTFRIGHMGEIQMGDLKELTTAIIELIK